MPLPRLALVMTAVAALATPALAQQTPAPTSRAADAREQPVTQALNTVIDNNLNAQAAISAEQQAQYDLDRAAYREAVMARAAVVGADKARYVRQEDAYARAMIAWRIQTDECKRGILKSCSKPTPRPADFY
ncbi:MAG: hypothetical protein ABW173_08095 [Sphingomonas sp.]